MVSVLVIGGGGREHAIAWKLSESPEVDKVFIAPGNAGTSLIGENIPIKASEIKKLADFTEKENISLTIVGPEAPLVNGIIDEFEKRGLKIFGPNKQAAMLEGSKLFAKKIMEEGHVPTGKYKAFTDYQEAVSYIEESEAPFVIKADGLAAGKGVTVASSKEEAINALKEMLVDKKFGEAGSTVLVEEFLKGEEASMLAFVDGKNVVLLESSQDHKRAFDGDKGPNTGGMGAYSPAPIITREIRQEILEKIMKPTVKALKEKGIKYKGILYAGLMITEEGPKVLEFNVRFGDPETQAVLFRMKSDLYELMIKTVNEQLSNASIEWDERSSCCVIMASGGYPIKYEKGKEIKGLESIENNFNQYIFHAGTKKEGDKTLTSGGRVLGVTAKGQTIEETIKNAYSLVEKINFEKAFYRKDIGKKAIGK